MLATYSGNNNAGYSSINPVTISSLNDKDVIAFNASKNAWENLPSSSLPVIVNVDTNNTLVGNGSVATPLGVPIYSAITELSQVVGPQTVNTNTSTTIIGHLLDITFNNIVNGNYDHTIGYFTANRAGMWRVESNVKCSADANSGLLRSHWTNLTNALETNDTFLYDAKATLAGQVTPLSCAGSFYMDIGDTLNWGIFGDSTAATFTVTSFISVSFSGHG